MVLKGKQTHPKELSEDPPVIERGYGKSTIYMNVPLKLPFPGDLLIATFGYITGGYMITVAFENPLQMEVDSWKKKHV